MNTKKQGDIGLGKAISYYAELGYTVCIPLTDSQNYDLVVDDGNSVKRVQVKRCTFSRNGNYTTTLSTKGGNRSSTGKVKSFDKSKVDVVVVSTPEKLYVIPVEEIKTKDHLGLHSYYNKFVV